jgi:hypothetical protein
MNYKLREAVPQTIEKTNTLAPRAKDARKKCKILNS